MLLCYFNYNNARTMKLLLKLRHRGLPPLRKICDFQSMQRKHIRRPSEFITPQKCLHPLKKLLNDREALLL